MRNYTPRPGTLPANLIAWLKSNPEEELTRVDVASKFGMAPSTVGLALEAAVKSGALAFARNDELEMVYRLPKSGEKPPEPQSPQAPWPALKTNTPVPTRAQPVIVPPPTMDELKSLVVEKGKPVPKPGLSSRVEKWAPLLALLAEPDTSVAVRPEWVRGIKSYASMRNKRHKAANEPNRYTLGIDDAGAHRLWRTA